MMGATSEHFSETELRCKHCGVNNCVQELVDMLEWIRARAEDTYGMGRARIKVLSGYRCPAHNAAEGGAKASQHIEGKAADIAIEILQDRGKSKTEWVRITAGLAESLVKRYAKLGGLGRRDSTGMIHVDVREGPLKLWCYDATNKTVAYYPASGLVQST